MRKSGGLVKNSLKPSELASRLQHQKIALAPACPAVSDRQILKVGPQSRNSMVVASRQQGGR